MHTKVTRTFLRTDEMMSKYMQESEKRHASGTIVNPFANWNDSLVKEFQHWVIIKNDFPYDAIATISHMISTKREVAFDWDLLNEEELSEFASLKKGYIKDNYDVLFENLPKGQTFPGHFHLHLLVLKREDV